MLGFIIGTISLVALVRIVVRARRYRQGYGYGGYNRRALGPFEQLLAELRATPEQAKALREAAGELRGVGRTAWSALRDSRAEYARAMSADVFDEAALAPAYSRQDEALTTVNRALAGALLRAHVALEPEQRARLAAWISARALPGVGPAATLPPATPSAPTASAGAVAL